MDNFSAVTKTVCGLTAKGTAPILSVDRTILLTEKTQILQRWAEHFRGILNRLSTISDAPPTNCLKWRPTPNSTSRPLSMKPSGPYSKYLTGKSPSRTRSLQRPTVDMHRPPHNAAYDAPPITINGAQLQTVDTSTYLVAPTLAAPRIKDEVPPPDHQI
ncbi:hypothetical protein SprV_0301251800 [Sparganum proliferum]